MATIGDGLVRLQLLLHYCQSVNHPPIDEHGETYNSSGCAWKMPNLSDTSADSSDEESNTGPWLRAGGIWKKFSKNTPRDEMSSDIDREMTTDGHHIHHCRFQSAAVGRPAGVDCAFAAFPAAQREDTEQHFDNFDKSIAAQDQAKKKTPSAE